MIIIAKNTTGSDIELSDMYGIMIPASDQTTLTEQVPFPIIEGSLELRDYVTSGDIIINDGVEDLNASEGIEHLQTATKHEAPCCLPELNDVGPLEPNKLLRTTIDGTGTVWAEPVDNLDDLQDIPAKPGSGDYILRVVDGTFSWIESTTFIDHTHDLQDLDDVPTYPGTGDYVLESQDGTLVWVETPEDIIAHDLDFHSDVPTKPTTGQTVLQNTDGTLEWVDTTALVDHSHELEDHELDFHTDIPDKPTTGDYILRVVDGTFSWVDSTAFVDHEHVHSHDLQDLDDVPTYPGTGDYVLESQDGTLGWVETPSGVGNHDIDYHDDVPTKPTTSDRILKTTAGGGNLEWVDLNDFDVRLLHKFDGYHSTTSTTFTDTWTDVPLDVEKHKSAEFIHSANSAEVEFDQDGQYLIIARATIDISSDGNNRTSSRMQIMVDTGSGYNPLDGTLSSGYHRQPSQDENTPVSQAIFQAKQGDKIKVQVRRYSGSATLRLVSGGSALTIFNIGGVKGDKGDPGAGGEIDVEEDDVLVQSGITTLNFEGSVDVTNEGGGKVTITQNAGSKFVPFGKVDASGIGNGPLETAGNTTLGHRMPSSGSIQSVGIRTDQLNSNTYSLLIDSSSELDIIFSDQDEKTVDSLDIPYSKNQVLNAQITTQGSDIESPYSPDANTLFLAPMDGDDEDDRHVTNTSTITKGMAGRLVNGAAFSTTTKFGTSSVNFDGYNDYMQLLHHDAYNVQNCTVEFFFRPDDTYGDQIIFSKDASGYGGHLQIGIDGDDIYVRSQSTSNQKTIQFDPNIQAGTWYHVAVVMGTGGIKVFLDGTLRSSDGSWTQGLNGNIEPICIGCANSHSYYDYYNNCGDYFNGQVDELRISNTRRYETNFTVPSSAFTKDVNTVGLWHFDEGSGSLAYDSSDTIHNATMMATGSMCSINNSIVKHGTHSIFMNNSYNDWLRFNHNPLYESSEITVESWMYPKCDDGTIFDKGGYNQVEGGLIIKWEDCERIKVQYYGASTSRTLYSANGSFPDYQWHHFAVTINSSEIKLFIDGVEVDSETLTTDYQNVWANNKSDAYFAAKPNRSDWMRCHLDDFRISNIVRTYSSSNVKQISMLIEMI